MRYFLIIACCLVSLAAFAQRIDFRNDSLFINHYFVNNHTTKQTLDSLLQSKGKARSRTGHRYPGTNKRERTETYTYSSKGLVFHKNKDYDTVALSIGIKMNSNLNWYVDQSMMPTKTFTGSFFIDDNYMNDKKTADQLKQLRNCTISDEPLAFHSKGIIFRDIVYQKRPVSVVFDFLANTVTCIFIN